MKFNYKKIGLRVAAVAAVAAVFIATGGGAKAADLIDGGDIKNQSVFSADLGPDSVGTSELKDFSTYFKNLSQGTQDLINGKASKAQAKGYADQAETDAKGHANQVADAAENAAKGYADANDEVGSATVAAHLGSAATTIDKIGGPFADNATLLDTKHVDAGDYLVTSYAFFDRIDNSQSSTPVLQLAVRGVDGSQWGADYGTLFTNEYPATGNLEQTVSATRRVTVPEGGLDVKVYGFGYNANQSADGSGNYTVVADVNFVPVG